MNKILTTAAFAGLLAGTAIMASPAQASWAENSRSSSPVYSGTAQSQWRAEQSRRNYSYHAPRVRPGYWSYGSADYGYYGYPAYSYDGPRFYFR